MKKSLVASLIAVPLLTLSFHVSAAESETQAPMLLTSNQMDEVTAGGRQANRGQLFSPALRRSAFAVNKRAEITQINVSPVTIVQIGNNNTAIVYSGNFSWIYQ